MIINYILCISISILSAGKLVDLYIKADKLSQNEILQFEKKTKSLIQKENGFGTLLGIIITLVLSLIVYFLLLKLNIEHHEILNRKNTYLCYRKYSTETINLIEKTNKINWAIRTLYATSMTGVLSAESEAILKGLVFLQNTLQISYLKNINTISYCSLSNSLTFLQSLPYEINRNIDQTAKLKEESWKVTIFNPSKRIRVKKIFSLSITFLTKGSFDLNPKIDVKEIRPVL